MFDLSLIEQYQKHFSHSHLCVALFFMLYNESQRHPRSCFLRTNRAFYVSKYLPNMFIFYSMKGRKQLPWPLGQKDPFQSLFCSPTPLIFRISLRELWVLFFLRVSCGGCSGSPLQMTLASSSPLTAFFSHTPASFPPLASPGLPLSLSSKLFSCVSISRHYWKLPQTL